VATQQSNQPTQQGVNTNPTVYFYKTADRRYGFLHRKDDWQPENSLMRHVESQRYESRFTVSSLVIQKPAKPFGYTASDLVNDVAAIMQSDATRAILLAADVGILRVADVINPYFTDDRDTYEASPSFDFTLTYARTRVTIDPVIESYKFQLYRV
jgi:hypothetical protein